MFKQTANLKKVLFVLFVISALGLMGDLCQAQETVTITTYYPSPYGVYRNMQIIPSAAPPPCGAANQGTLYFDSSARRFYVCELLYGNVYGWGGMLWALQPGSNPSSPSNAYFALSGSLGIGTTSPSFPPPNNQSGNIDVNDVYLRSYNSGAGGWLSQALGGITTTVTVAAAVLNQTSIQTQSFAVAGAQVGDFVTLGPPGNWGNCCGYVGWISAVNTLSIRVINCYGSANCALNGGSWWVYVRRK
jgi:hypothetical protein